MSIWCEHCRDHFAVDHYDAEGNHRVGSDFGPTGSEMKRMHDLEEQLAHERVAKQSALAALDTYEKDWLRMKEQYQAAQQAVGYVEDMLRARGITRDTALANRLRDAFTSNPAKRLTCGKCGRAITEAESQWGWCPECAAADPDFLPDYPATKPEVDA